MGIRRTARAVTIVAVGVLGFAVAAPAQSQPVDPPTEQPPPIERSADEVTEVVEVTVDGVAEMDELVATGVDLDHHVTPTENGIVLHAVVTPSEQSALKARGFAVGRVIFEEEDSEARIAERDATIAAHVEENEAFAAEAYPDDGSTAPDVSDVKIIRADYYTSFGNPVLSVEAKWANGQNSSAQLQVQRDSGPGTEFGSGGTQNISRFVDAGVYLYHRGASSVTTRPDRIRITSPTGDVAIAKVNDWLPLPGEEETDPSYQTGFITSYLTPTELYDRIKALAEEFPEISEIVELPHETNGYRRNAQALLGSANASRVGIDSRAWGHEGGNDVTVAAVNPGAPDSPLSVSVTGNDITLNLATSSTGALTSTAAQVVAAINAHPAASELVFAYTYRGNAGNGVVAAASRTALSDLLTAPDTVSRDPHPVYALRIGKHRDGSKMGVLAYAQEHAREWVPPLVTIETAERLLRNYATHGPTKQLVNNLDIWIAPSINPDGGHYSFYDRSAQRRTMTRHCAVTGNYDVLARGSWGVDTNRNYDQYSLFDGYSGASTSCTSDVFAGPAELSEPENRNLDWLASQPNLKFAMNLHSSGNYFMWSPGSYATPGRISAPRPTLEEESYFWGASSRILTEIKKYRGLSVTPARTGPISDVLYSAAGNSGDMLWYKYRLYAWNFEVGTSFQPPFEGSPTGGSARRESQEFANGLVELMRVAYDFGKDSQRPESSMKVRPASEAGKVLVTFEATEPAAVFYSIDGSIPTYQSELYGSAGIREGGETLVLDEGTTVHWFSVDSAGNVERNYRPDGNAKNFSKGVAVVTP
jgi:hypothetical protein